MSIEVRNVTKSFGGYTALRGVNLRVGDGELVALLGPSGSGKTTLLRIIAGLEVPDDNPGSAVIVDGEEITRREASYRRVGFVFQHYALFRHMTVFENIAFGLRVRPRSRRPSTAAIQARVAELLKLIQLEPLAQRYPAQLSGGQRQRVALARALAIEPKVLLLDEPFGALDAKVRHELRRWLRRLHDEIHVTSILVTHDQDEALEVADRIVVMNQARIEQIGSPEDVFHNPASAFVMDFLGQVNLFHGRVEAGRPVFTQAPGPESRSGDRIFVRPHQIEIDRSPNGGSTIRAKVRRILATGAVVKVELEDASASPILVELTHERFRELAIERNEEVFVSPREAKVFREDYSI